MVHIKRSYILLGLGVLSNASPLVPRNKLDDLHNAYPGIYWDYAANEKECTIDQYNIIAESLRVTLDLAAFPQGNDRYSESAAWNRFFVKDNGGNYGWHSSELRQDRFLAITNAIKQASEFPREGKRNRKSETREDFKISVRCHELVGLRKCTDDKGKPTHVGAYTSRPGKSPGWSIVFCPKFFSLRYLNEITAGPKRQPSDLTRLDIRSFEYVFVHELMHADIIGTKFHILDMQGNIPGQPDGQYIYGATLCHEYAWRDTRSAPVSVNTLTAYNADNHAWFLINFWFQYKWNWSWDDGKNLRKRELDPAANELDRRADDPKDMILYDPDDKGTENQGDPGPLPNCGKEDGVDYCSYVGEDYDDYLVDRTKPFTSKGGCELSKFCWSTFGAYALDPKCICKCKGQITPLRDPRCAGYEGSLPDPPLRGHLNGP
ncbi:MAG: hypothetical protein M1814_002152 [Vezdaea aestivalis]|nr:MAG: hypothetical protein M1814_002152 [Vezdaea aestivalis]